MFALIQKNKIKLTVNKKNETYVGNNGNKISSTSHVPFLWLKENPLPRWKGPSNRNPQLLNQSRRRVMQVLFDASNLSVFLSRALSLSLFFPHRNVNS